MTDSGGNIYTLHPVQTLCKPFELRDEKDIPRREWLYGGWLIRGFVSSLLGKGGSGKTSHYIAVGLALATGRDLLGVKPPHAVPVWFLNLEDPGDEMERRIAAAARRHGVTNEQLKGRLFVDGLPREPLVLLKRGYEGVEIDQDAIDHIVKKIERHGIGLLVPDPFVATHTLNENDNGEMNAAIVVWRTIAARTGCAILLVHHTPKGRVADDAADEAGRGATSLRDGVRSSRFVRSMAREEAEKLGVAEAERRQYILISDAKNNMAQLGIGEWARLTPVRLDNGDDVGVVESWSPPEPLAGIEAAALDEVVADLATRGPQRASEQSAGWFGWRVAQVCFQRFDREAATKTRSKGVLRQLERQGRIRIVDIEIGRKGRPHWTHVPDPEDNHAAD